MRTFPSHIRGLLGAALPAIFLLHAVSLGALLPKPPGAGPLAAKTKYGNPPVDSGTVTSLAKLKAQAAAAPSPALTRMTAAWSSAAQVLGPRTIVNLDLRTGGPLGVEPDGFPWIPGDGMNNHLTRQDIARYLPGGSAPIDPRDPPDAVGVNQAVLEKIARSFMSQHPDWFPVPQSELRLHLTTPDPQHYVKHVMFDQFVNGVPVENALLVFHVGHGNLISFGGQWTAPVAVSTTPRLSPDDARRAALGYAGLGESQVAYTSKPSLELIIVNDGAATAPGGGYPHRLVYSVGFRHPGESGTWQADVDAQTGEVVRFRDINDYNGAIVGGVQPSSNDGICPTGCEQAGFPMPFANTGLVAPNDFTDTGGNYAAGGGATVTTTLNGKYVAIADTCGAMSKSGTDPATIDLGMSGGTDCIIPAGGGGPGNTHSARDAFYNVNKLKEEVRGWLPAFAFNNGSVTVNVNLNQTCNAYWNGTSLNMFHDGGNPSCRNTGEIAMIFDHELGHGYDANDGGGAANPGEAYADNTATIHHHDACIGRGFFKTAKCGGYGDGCITCTGVRGSDWTGHTAGYPHTVFDLQTGNNTAPNTPMECPAGGDICGFETHCAAYPITESVWDAAVIDLPHNAIPTNGGAACAGTSPGNPTTASQSWTLLSKIWWKGVGTLAAQYTCAVDGTAGCGATTTFHVLKVQDDDDGNLTNGSPHAAELQCAFGRHQVGCTTDTNTDTTSCLPLLSPTVTATAGSGQITLNWTAVTNATQYRIFRNEESCGSGYALIATVAVPTLTYNDTGLLNGRTYYYQVQPIGGASNQCDGQPSACTPITPQPCAGSVQLSRQVYSCSDVIGISLTDSDLTGTGTHAVTVRSTTESTPETKILTETPPSSGIFTGTIATGAPPPVNGDNKVSVVNGDTITVSYLDASFCGTPNVPVNSTASADCLAPVISSVLASAVTGQGALITWTTNEVSNSRVDYGTTPPPGSNVTAAANVTAHSMPLTGLAECTGYLFSVQSTDPANNTATANNGGSYYGFTTGKNNQPSYTSTDTPVSIPDNSPTGATSTIVVPDNKPVVKVTVTVNITHTYDGDLTLNLIPPTGPTIVLSARRGTSGDNFTATVFDDAASTPIASGTAPFTGSFIPDAPLSGANGITAAGNWSLFVVDGAAVDVGTIDSWTLNLTYPAAACGPNIQYSATTNVADLCNGTGTGGSNTYWDSGEQVQFSITAQNTGTVTLTGVRAFVTPTTPGVVMTDNYATFPDIPAGGNAVTVAPHFTAQLPGGLTCGGNAGFNVDIVANEASASGSFTHVIGQVGIGGGTVLNEDFAAGIPATWTVVDGGTGGGAAATWTTANPGARVAAAPIAPPFAIVDSDNAGTGATQDEQLITPVLNLSTATTVTLEFDHQFRFYTGGTVEKADVDVMSSLTSGVWVNVASYTGTSDGYPNPPVHKLIDITAQAAGAANVQVRFHYYNGTFEWWWMIDNVKVSYTAPGGCTQASCTPTCPFTAMSRVNEGKQTGNVLNSWTAVGGTANYNIYRVNGLAAGNWGAALATVPGATLSWPDPGELGNTTSRYYTVTDINGCGTESPK